MRQYSTAGMPGRDVASLSGLRAALRAAGVGDFALGLIVGPSQTSAPRLKMAKPEQ